VKGYVRRHTFRRERPPVTGRQARRSRRPTGGDCLSIAAAIDLFCRALPTLTSRRGTQYSPHTVTNYRDHLQPFARWCGDRALWDFEARTLLDYRAHLRERGAAANTVSRRENAIGVFLNWCVQDRQLLRRSPLLGVARAKAPLSPLETLRPEEIARLLESCDRMSWWGTRNHALLFVLWRTGVRARELVNLDLGDYEEGAQQLRVRQGKGRKDRIVGVPDDCALALEDWVTVFRGREAGPLFWSERDSRLTRNAVSHLVPKLAARAGVRHCYPHMLRHTFALDCLDAGVDGLDLMRLMGHTTMDMVQVYLRAQAERRAAERHVETMRGRRSRRR